MKNFIIIFLSLSYFSNYAQQTTPKILVSVVVDQMKYEYVDRFWDEFGEKGIKPYRYLFVIFVFLGAIAKLSVVLNISDGVYGLLAIPNMIACFLLMPVVKKTLKEYKHKLSTGVIKRID